MTFDVARWKDVFLGEVCEFKYGKSLPAKSRVRGRFGVFGSNGQVGTHNAAITHGPTIVVGRKGSLGEVTYSDRACWPIDTTYYIDESATVCDLRWLARRLGALGLAQLNRAAAVPGLNRDDAYRKRMLLPPIEEQQRIAYMLDRADTLRAKRREALAHLDDLTQSIFLEMFGDPITNPRQFPLASLEDLGRVVTGRTPPSTRSGMFGDSVPFITPGDLESTGPPKRMLSVDGARVVGTVRKGATLVCCIGATIGKTGYASSQSAFNQQINAVEWAPLINDMYGYMSLRWRKQLIAASSTSTTLPILNKSGFKRLQIPIPPIELQAAFAKAKTAVEGVSDRAGEQLVSRV